MRGSVLVRCFPLLCRNGRVLHTSSCNRTTTQSENRSKPFPVLDGEVDTSSANFQRNTAASKAYTETFQQIMAKSLAGGGEKGIARHVKQNKKLLAADRVKLLLDDADEFLELSTFAGHAMPYGDVARAGLITGIGKVHGKYCMIVANDGSVKGGTVFPITLKKQLRAQEIAQQNFIPCIYAVDSGGAFLPLQAEIFNPGGQSFYNEAVMGAMGIPQIAVVCGNCTAGGAYVPTMADEAVIIHKIGTIFLGGPPLVQAATGEIVSTEDLGGATLHCNVSGCTDYFAATEEEGFRTGRDIVEGLNLPPHLGPPRTPEEPLYDSQDIAGLIPAKGQENMDIRKVIARIVDGSRFQEFKLRFGTTLVTGFAHIQGYLVGIVANSGELSDTAAAKGAHFVSMCSERNIPLVFLHNTSAQSGDKLYGLAGGNLLRDHAKMMAAVSCAKVPKISVVVGNSIGPDNYLMCGRSCSPNFMFTWPNAVIGMAEKSHLVNNALQTKLQGEEVDATQRVALERKVAERYSTETAVFYAKLQGKEVDPEERAALEKKVAERYTTETSALYAKLQGKEVDPEERAALEKKVAERYSMETSAFYVSSRLLDDGMILPHDTRKVIGRCLDITAAYLPPPQRSYPVIRM